MKKILSLLTLMLLAVAGLFAQSPAPGILNYQGVARNSVGNVLVNKNITLRLTIRDGSAAGPTVYSETRAVTTNPFGLFNVQLGSAGASAVTGTIAGVPWGVGLKYIQVEIDPNGGSSFINIGTAQLASVPYSLYSTIANDLVLPFNKTQADAGTLFKVTNSGSGSGSTALEGVTNSGAANAVAVLGTVNNGSAGGFSAAVRGNNLSTTGLGIGVYGSQGGSGWGVYGVTPNGIGVNGSGGNGVGVWGSATTGVGGRFTSTSGLALHTSGGGVRLQNINEAANRILTTIPGDGTATWQDPAAVGIVTGSGTLNFVPKWTPNGTNLGNSQIFDNGTLVGVGAGNAPFAGKLDVLSGVQQIVAHRFTGVTGFDLFYNNTNTYNGYIGTWNTGTSTRNFDVGTGDINNVGSLNLVTQAIPRMSILPDGTVGVNTTAPVSTSKMQINGTGATGSILTRTSLFTGGNLDGANGHGVIADGEWRAVWGRNLGSGGRIEATGVRGEAGGSNYNNGAGVLGTATGTGTNIGVSGLASGSAASNTGLRGQATVSTAGVNWGVVGISSNASGQTVAVTGSAPVGPNSWAGAFFGRVNITDGTEALNRVFTSDAVGNGSWQPLAAIGGVTGSGTTNFVAKWTPSGTNLGNSLIFDDNSTVSVGGGGFVAPNSLSVLTTSSSGGNASVGVITATQAAGLYLEEATGDLHITANFNDVDGGTKHVTVEDISGNVGIGTATPGYKLDISHPGSDGIHVASTGSFSVVDIEGATGDAALRFQSAGGVFQWNTRNRPGDNYYEIFEMGSASRLVIQDGTGNVGISTNNPTARLHVTGQNSASFNIPNGYTTVPAIIGQNLTGASADKTGIVGHATGGTSQNNGVVGTASGNATFNIGGGFIADQVSTGTNVGVFATASNGASNLAGFFVGAVRINDGTAAPGRLFVSTDGAGTGNWQTAAGAGLVSGSGTLNYVPKWTPNGTTLGNSLTYDDGLRVQVGDNVIGGSSLGINPTPGSPLPSITWYKNATGNAFNIHETDNGSLQVEANNTAAGSGSIIMTFDDDNLSVGIGNTTPAARLDINNTATGIGAALINQDNELAIPGLSVYTENITTRFDRPASISAQRENWTGSTAYWAADNAIFGAGMNGSIGVQGTTQSGIGVAGVSTTGVAVRATTLTGTALVTSGGGVRFESIGAANGYVLTSDAVGNATWQENTAQSVGISGRTFLATNTIPSGVTTPLINWATILNEDGGANFNALTGEYTITKTGTYQINGSVLWNPTASGGAGVRAIMMIYVNGGFEFESNVPVTQNTYVNSVIAHSRRYNAGDVIQFRVYQDSGADMTLSSGFFGQHFSIQFMHK